MGVNISVFVYETKIDCFEILHSNFIAGLYSLIFFGKIATTNILLESST